MAQPMMSEHSTYLIDVSGIAATCGLPNDRIAFDRAAWAAVVAWDRPAGAEAMDGDLPPRIANVLRWLRPGLGRLQPTAGTVPLQGQFTALQAWPNWHGSRQGEKHCPVCAAVEMRESGAGREIVLSLAERGW